MDLVIKCLMVLFMVAMASTVLLNLRLMVRTLGGMVLYTVLFALCWLPWVVWPLYNIGCPLPVCWRLCVAPVRLREVFESHRLQRPGQAGYWEHIAFGFYWHH